MRMVDLIEKKKDGKVHTAQEIHFIVDGYTNDKIPDYQMSAWLMAVCFQGLNNEETALLTKEMMHSGDVIDLSRIEGIKVDKHSTGGVGDKTSMVLGPIVGACGVPVAKMSGRGLGHTGGTLDKLESIPGLHVMIEEDDFVKQVNDCHLAIIGQSAHLDPADKKMYALRDVTATVSCIPLIASSIMSKKLAAGSDAILLDVKYGDGAFMKTKEEAKVLARTMIEIGDSLGKDTRATISNMSQPLGCAIGNILEVKEAVDTLNGNGPEDLLELCLQAGSHMLMQAQKADSLLMARKMLQEAIDSKQALRTFCAMVKAQGGDDAYIRHPEMFPKAKEVIPVYSQITGYVKDLKAKPLGIVSMKLGGGRETTDDEIDYSVGLILHKKIGDFVKKGDLLVEVHTNTGLSKELQKDILDAYEFSNEFVNKPILIDEVLS
ncbi:pyrimidine-nucleoside phosphorylase [Massilimicrobiota timonensis]|uniref:pyrimidine-nucleoside phosphorylase n=1 Tax=Massilimicrobiota timonensis TaxID=1776392 RepID=UPI0019609A15|nr:pyrimidine-nucleoside phosphorylase [Massilimicrobiota timonensis]MBM6966160.1 pyrimidine-nucleoside phosphorylase [Massilimicrobiota timonensis]